MRSFLLFLSFFISTGLVGQAELYEEVASDICQCLGKSDESGGPNRAMECMTASIGTYRQELRQVLDLSGSQRISRNQLTEVLLEPLVENCPLLETLFPMIEEVEYRWSDNPVSASGARIVTAKFPKADPKETTTTEAPAQWRASGRLLTRAGGGTLRLEMDSGEIWQFELPGRVARGKKLVVGEPLDILYRREWRTTDERGVVVKVVTEIVL